MKKIVVVPMVAGIMALGVIAVASNRPVVADNPARDIVGAWEVTAVAPYAPHLMVFNADGTLNITNPTNVQENPSDPHGGTNDSLGMGVWDEANDHGTKYIEGTFEELNAFADNHQPTDTLSVSFKLKMTDNNDGFDGPAIARLGTQTVGSHLTGSRIHIDQAVVDTL